MDPSTSKLPGIFAGRFPIDINSYDPRAASLHNPFKDPPLGYVEAEESRDPLPFNNVCNHNFTIKASQTLVDLPSERPDGSVEGYDKGKVAAICQKCNWHLDIKVMWTQEQFSAVCPTSDNPMHFFVLAQAPNMEDPSGKQSYYFQCQDCATRLEISYRPPRLTAEYYSLLISPANLKARAEEAARKEAGRQGIEPQPGIRVLEALASYLTDALSGISKGIPAHNKRFMTSFGDECTPLLNWLGFKRVGPEGAEGTDDWAEHDTWNLPKVQAATPLHWLKTNTSNRVRIEDIVEELWAHMRRQPAGQLAIVKHRPPTMTAAEPSIAVLLGADKYQKATGLLARGRRPVAGVPEDDECYAGLGIARDFAPELVMFAFRRQATWMPDQSAFFYDCILAVSQKRMSEDMNVNIATLMSQGYFTRDEVKASYRYLGFNDQAKNWPDLSTISDNDILGRFDSRLQNTAKSQEGELRNKLRIIAKSRGSVMLESASENVSTDEEILSMSPEPEPSVSWTEIFGPDWQQNPPSFEHPTSWSSSRTAGSDTGTAGVYHAVDDYELTNEAGALRWLNPTYNGTVSLSDDSVIAMAVSKLVEAEGNQPMKDLCYKAVEVIASERQSEGLRSWLATKGDGMGDYLNGTDIAFNNAKRYFDIPETQTDVDLGVLESMMQMRIQDDPSTAETARNHFDVIRERMRQLELQVLNRPPPAGDYTMPVGLTNMGNTCYLNSYLQFFFAVKPLRDLILDFDTFKINTDDLAFVPKKVDGLTIRKADTIKTQEFVRELQGLFGQMTTAPGPVVDPTWQLAVLALESGPLAAQAAVSARRATLSGVDGSGLPVVMSPLRATAREPILNEEDPMQGLTSDRLGSSIYGMKTANSSEVTLIDSKPRTPDTDMEVHMGDEPDTMMLDDLLTDDPPDMDKGKGPLLDGMDQDTDHKLEPEAMPLLAGEDSGDNDLPEPSEPQRPPPVPPRPAKHSVSYGPLNRAEAIAAVPPLMLQTDMKNTNKMKAEAAALQQDVDEAMGNVLFKIQCSIKGHESTALVPSSSRQQAESTDLIKETFYGQFVWRYMDSKTEPMNEGFSAINISLAEKPANVTAGLESAFAVDEVSLDGKRTRRYRTITTAPPIFQVYLQRQYFDAKKGDAVINKHFIQLEQKIYLDRFMSEEGTDVQQLREKAWRIDAQLERLRMKRAQFVELAELDAGEAEAGPSTQTASKLATEAKTQGAANATINKTGPELLDDTWAFISRHGDELEAGDAVLDALKQQAESRRNDISKLDKAIEELQARKAVLFDGHRRHAYRLAAVFVHRGQGGARGGHYWIYICDFGDDDAADAGGDGEAVDAWGDVIHSGKWRRYEDSDVSLVTETNEIFRERDPEKDGAPYFLVYVKDEGREEVMDPLHRVKPPPPEEEEEPEQGERVAEVVGDEDVEMGGVSLPPRAVRGEEQMNDPAVSG